MDTYDKNIKKILKKLRPDIELWLKENVSENRRNHILRVAKTAKKYARKLGLDVYKAELSGLLHDLAKELTNEKLLEISKTNNLEFDEIDLDNPHILHARVGEILAKEKFGINDPDVLGGIRCHTLAEPNMSKIMMVVYLADATEPGRDKKFAGSAKKVFKEKGLEAGVLEAINMKLKDVINRGKKIHLLTIKARNWLLSNL